MHDLLATSQGKQKNTNFVIIQSIARLWISTNISSYIRRCVMVSLPLHGKINAFNGDNIVAFNNIFVIIDIHIGVIYT